MTARGVQRGGRLGQTLAAVLRGGGVLQVGQGAAHLRAAVQRMGQAAGNCVEIGVAGGQRRDVLFNLAKRAAGKHLAGGGQHHRQIAPCPRQSDVHPPPAGQGLDLVGHRGHQAAADGQAVAFPGFVFIQPPRALPHPQQPRRAAIGAPVGQPGKPGLGLVCLGNQTVGLPNLGSVARHPPFENAKAAFDSVNFNRHFGGTTSVGPQRLDFLAF